MVDGVAGPAGGRRWLLAVVLVVVTVAAATVLAAGRAAADPDPPGRNDAVCGWGDPSRLRIETIFRFADDNGVLRYTGFDGPDVTAGSAFVSAWATSVYVRQDGQSAVVEQ